MRGRPKGTNKTNSKKLKTFRLSAEELNIVKTTLQLLRNPITITGNFHCKNIALKFINTSTIEENVLYTFCGTADQQYIAKCPVISTTSRSVEIVSKSMSGNIVHQKINKCNIDKLNVFTAYDLALANYLYRIKGRIITNILALNNPEVNRQFLIYMSDNIINALEYGAHILEMEYIFKLEDITMYR